MHIAVIGGGVSGIAAAHVLKKHGHIAEVFEKSGDLGGVWALAYPGVALQNFSSQYRFADLPWPFKPQANPTGEEIRRYLQFAVGEFGIEVRFNHSVESLLEEPDGWSIRFRNSDGEFMERFDYVVVAIGQYTEGKHRPKFAGEISFTGKVMTERDLLSVKEFADKKVAVVGFGKSAVDMAALAAPVARQVDHVFRTPRWLIPPRLFGLHNLYFLFNRSSTSMMSSWVHPSRFVRFIHAKLPALVTGYWAFISWIYRLHSHLHPLHFNGKRRERFASYLPEHGVLNDMRSALAVQPGGFYNWVKKGRILPHHDALEAFTDKGLLLKSGEEVAADVVVLSLGSKTPRFPFMPEPYRAALEAEHDGPQLYRHMIHPDIKSLAFAGFNHGFMHIPAAEVGMHWICALLAGDIELPSPEVMKASTSRVQQWKRGHVTFEPSRACAVNTRYQQYIDTLLKDMDISPYRKMPNFFAELFSSYGADEDT
jgi:cation diffusion facilitator CzcD-associated flavoprotein CzcO